MRINTLNHCCKKSIRNIFSSPSKAAAGYFNSITGLLEERRLLLHSGTIVDATIIAAPSSTKNASANRDPQMKQTRKGRDWHFGIKLHIGGDQRGIVHTVRATAASVADITQLLDLLHGPEREGFGNQAYWKEDDREFLQAWGMRYRINRRPTSKRPLSERWRMINRARSLDGRMLQTIERIERQARHQAILIDDLLDISRFRYGKLQLKKETLDLRIPVKHAVETLQNDFQTKQLKLDVHLPPRALFGSADSIRIGRFSLTF